ncbi:hypothetical protein ABVK25_008168 [Lepraria finkii]|uniref:GPI anchored protein n=1 Tax=Lepraria finkii TaxID=1340010 RepID=A0ABR4B0T5_9LECA
MLPLAAIQLVPASLILFMAAAPPITEAREMPWPFGSRSLQDGGVPRRDGAFASDNPEQMLVGVRKMSDDEGEMFFPEYWNFETTSQPEPLIDKRDSTPYSPLDGRESFADWASASIPQPLQAPFALHTSEQFDVRPLLGRLLKSSRAIFTLEQRDFQCPGDTTVCSSINQPNSCCPTGTICQSIKDSGNGAVGCCPSGQTCNQQVSDCQAPDTSCPGSSGGGCCIQGYTCSGVGCVANSTVTTTIEPVVTLSPTLSPSTSSAAASSSTAPIINTSTFTATASVIATVTGGPSRDPPTNTSPSSTTPSSITPLPSSTSTSSSTTTSPSITTPSSTTRLLSSTSTSSSTTALIPAVRPTSSGPLTITASQCPTGFYQCSAYNHPGCCQVGRDCGLTSCPAASSSIALNSTGVTIAGPSGTQPALGVSGCAQGWFNCGSGGGGGCCP